jgi:hypothetical protein
MSKSSAQSSANKSSGSTRSTASLMHRGQATFGPHACIQRDATHALVHPEAPSLIRETLAAPGRPLDADTRSDMEETFGQSFSQVRVHTDERAAASAKAVGAGAYATGSDVAFAPGRYAPGTESGRRTLVHELSHVVQQSQGPVSGTDIGGGLSVSDPSDRFERQARETSNGGGLPQQASAQKGQSRRDPSGPLSIQRVGPNPLDDQSGPGAFQKRSTEASEKAADAGVASAVFGGLSAFEAIRSASFTGRQAEAAEDPPIQTPTSTGVSVTDVDIPESKGIEKSHLSQHQETEKTTIEETYGTVPKKDADGKDIKGSDRAEGGKNPHVETKTTDKEGETPDQEDRFHILHVSQGTTDSASFYVNLLHGGLDIKGGTTEQGEYKGYKGGTNNANLSLTFKASKGGQWPVTDDKSGAVSKPGPDGADKNMAGTARLTFRGTNAPPRKKLNTGLGAGFSNFFFGGGGPSANKDYDKQVQNFNGAVRLTGTGKVLPDLVPKGATQGDGTENSPLFSLALGASGDAAGASAQKPSPGPAEPKKADGPAPGGK